MAETITQVETTKKQSFLVDMRPDIIVRVAVLGLLLGAVGYAISLGLSEYVVRPVFCSGANGCGDPMNIAGNITLVLLSIAGMTGLIKTGAYRPMLVAVAVAITLWGIGSWIGSLAWYEALGWSALLYAVAYSAYAWLVRPRNFIVVIIILALIIGGTRYLSMI